MTRAVCLAVVLGSLLAAPGCNCLGGRGCSRQSFMEFRSPCRRQAEPCGMPVADPCGQACPPAPCCEEGGTMLGGPASTPVVTEPGTFS